MSYNENDFIKVNTELSSDDIHVRVESKEKTRFSQDIVAVVDTSGSMLSSASIKTSSGVVESGLAVIDIVKHALNTIVESLDAKDRFSLVIYSYEGKVVVPLTSATEDFKKDIKEKISFLKPYGQTNLWDGLLKGMNELKTKDVGNNKSIILLTDGCPNVEPPRGHIKTLEKYLEKHSNNFSLYTCGFGYDMDSPLLVKYSKMAPLGGSYSFIPDSGMVGTIFINLMANIYSQQVNNLKIEFPKELVEEQTEFSHLSSCGQSIMLKINPSYLTQDISLKVTGEHLYFGEFEIILKPTIVKDEERFNFEKVRFIFNKFMEKSVKHCKIQVEDFISQIKDIPSNKMIDALLEDVNGQIKEAFQPQYYKRWGKHYLPSLLMAHQQGKCNNFKDPGVQVYQDEKFMEYQEKMEEIFTKLPPPTPSNPKQQVSVPGRFSMNTYYSSNNPCYAPECLTTLENGTKISVGDLKKGMRVITVKGVATIKLVVVSRIKNHETLMCHFDTGLKITPYHPIKLNGYWTYPCKVVEPIPTRTPVVISVVLDKYHILRVDDIETVTLGHDLTEPIVSHSFFGSPQVMEQLQHHPTFESGTVILPEETIERDPNTNMVVGFKF